MWRELVDVLTKVRLFGSTGQPILADFVKRPDPAYRRTTIGFVSPEARDALSQRPLASAEPVEEDESAEDEEDEEAIGEVV